MCFRKRIISAVLVFAMIVTSVTVGMLASTDEAYASTNHTQSEALSWAQANVGMSIDVDGYYGAQCVDLIMAYYNYLVGYHVSGNGKDYATNSLPSGWSRVQGGTPQPGDILVYGASSSNSYGHVAIYGGGKVTYHQNYNSHSYIEKVTNVSYNGFSNPYWGYIRPDWSNGNPIGFFDSLSSASPGTIYVSGWGFDPDSLGSQIEIHVYIGAAADAGGEGHVIKADKSRTDVNNVYNCGVYHGFASTIETSKTGSQTVYVYAINTAGSGSNVFLGSKQVNIKSANPSGCLDVVQAGNGNVFVRGWAFDPEYLGSAIAIHVYVGDEGHAITANTYRDDVNKVYSCGNYHGYNSTITTNKRGYQTVYVHAINKGRGTNVLLGKKDVYINNPDITSALNIANKTYTGKAVKPSITVKCNSIVLKAGTDYKVSYSNNIKCGKAKASITGIGIYAGTLTKTFIIKPAKATISKATAGSKKITVSIKSQKTSGVTGYQIYYKKSGSSAKTVTTTSTSKVLTGLTKGKKYTVKVRAYKTINGKKYYGAYSASKTVTVK